MGKTREIAESEARVIINAHTGVTKSTPEFKDGKMYMVHVELYTNIPLGFGKYKTVVNDSFKYRVYE